MPKFWANVSKFPVKLTWEANLLRLRRKVLFTLNLLRKKFLSGKFMKENSKDWFKNHWKIKSKAIGKTFIVAVVILAILANVTGKLWDRGSKFRHETRKARLLSTLLQYSKVFSIALRVRICPYYKIVCNVLSNLL